MRRILISGACSLAMSMTYAEGLDAQQSCDKGDGEACLHIGSLYAKDNSYQNAIKYIGKACSLDHGFGCFVLGFAYEIGEGVKQSYKEAKKLFEKSCTLNCGNGCAELGFLYANGHGVKQSYQKANKYLKKACSLENNVGCYGLGRSYIFGYGVEQSYRKARKYFEKSCSLNESRGCFFTRHNLSRWVRSKTIVQQS